MVGRVRKAQPKRSSLRPAWPAPMIQQMARLGAPAEKVRGAYPSVTYPSHTTIITRALPARHGVYYESRFFVGGCLAEPPQLG